jgi:hypothetical protein
LFVETAENLGNSVFTANNSKLPWAVAGGKPETRPDETNLITNVYEPGPALTHGLLAP